MNDIISEKTLPVLLERQDSHDEKFHREIARLSRGSRMQHLALHVSKYVGRIAGMADEDEQDLVRTLTDCAIICLSACNALGVSARQIINSKSAVSNLWQVSTLDASKDSVARLALRLAKSGGKLAKACEALDHLEPIDYAAELRNAVLETLLVICGFAARSNIDLQESILKRWDQIEHDRVP